MMTDRRIPLWALLLVPGGFALVAGLDAALALLVTRAPRNLGSALLRVGSATPVAVYVSLWRRAADVAPPSSSSRRRSRSPVPGFAPFAGGTISVDASVNRSSPIDLTQMGRAC